MNHARVEFDLAQQRRDLAVEEPAGDARGISLAAVASGVTTDLIPGAHFGGQSEVAWKQGRYGMSALYFGAALLEVGLAVFTGGGSAVATASSRTAAVAATRGAVRGGETVATRAGRAAHKAFDPGPGFQKEFRLPSGRRPDAVNFETKQVLELKPNNPRAIQRGERQVQQYVDELNEAYGGGFTGKVVTY
jgi:hypothetical protein